MSETYGLFEADGSMVRGKKPPQGIGSYIADCYGSLKYARRIVACVNACAEISNEALEDVAFRKTELEKLGELRDLSTDKSSENIIARHDAELLRAAADRAVATAVQHCGWKGDCSSWYGSCIAGCALEVKLRAAIMGEVKECGMR